MPHTFGKIKFRLKGILGVLWNLLGIIWICLCVLLSLTLAILYTSTTLMLNLGVWVLVAQNILAVFSFFCFLAFVEKNYKVNFSKFMLVYLTLEGVVEGVFIMSYLTGWVGGVNLLVIFKLGMPPVIYYKYLLNSLLWDVFYVSVFFQMFNMISKVWFMVLILVFPYNYTNLLVLMIICLGSLSNSDKDLENLVFKSQVLSNISLIFSGFYLKMEMVGILLISSSYLQFKALGLLQKSKGKFSEDFLGSTFYLMLLNGSLIFPLNSVKVFVFANILKDLGMMALFPLVGVSTSLMLTAMLLWVKVGMSHSKMGGSLKPKTFKGLMLLFGLGFLNMSCVSEFGEMLEALEGLEVSEVLGAKNPKWVSDFKNLMSKSLKEGSSLIKEFNCNYFLETGFSIFMLKMLWGSLKDFFKFWSVGAFQMKLEEVLSNFFFSEIFPMSGGCKKYFKMLVPIFMLSLPVGFMLLSSNNLNNLYGEVGKNTSTFFGGFLQVMAYQWGWFLTLVLMSPNYYNSLEHPTKNLMNVLGVEEVSLSEKMSPLKGVSKYSKVLEEEGGESFPMPFKTQMVIQTSSLDVIHALGSPSLGFKWDILGDKSLEGIMNTFLDLGKEFEFMCYEYCGQKHTKMGGTFIVTSPQELSMLGSL